MQPVSASDLTDAVDAFQTELNSLFCDGLSVGGSRCPGTYGVQNFLNSFHDNFDDGTEDVSDVVQQIMDRVNSELNLRAAFLTNLSLAINTSCSSYRWGIYSQPESLANFHTLHFAGNTWRGANLPSDMAYNPVYGQAVSTTKSTYRLPNTVDYNQNHIMRDASVSHMLEAKMVELHDNHCVDPLSAYILCSDSI